MKQARGGFTLVEVITVTAISAVLIAIAIPVFGTMRRNADSAACLSNLRQIGVGLNLYLNDHEMVMPPLAAGRLDKSEEIPVMDNTLDTYLPDPNIFRCRSDKKIYEKSGTSYYWNSALNGQNVGSLNFLNMVDSKSRIPVMSDKEGWHINKQKVNFLYADGHVSRDFRLFTED